MSVVISLSTEVTSTIFKLYATGDVSWKDEYPWEPQETDAAKGSGCLGVILIMLVPVSIAAAVGAAL